MRRGSGVLFDVLTRFGYVSRGALYVVIGGIAARVAVVSRGQAAGTLEALRAIFRQQNGRPLLGAIGVGFLCLAAARLGQALFDRRQGFGHLLRRAGLGSSGVLYAGLALASANLLFHLLPLGQTSFHAAELLRHAAGRWVLLGAGLALEAVALLEIVESVAGRLGRRLEVGRLSRARVPWIRRVVRFGLAAHGIVMGLVGFTLVDAAQRLDPDEIRETGGALRTLGRPPFGPPVLAIVAAGLAAYGVSLWMLALDRHRVIS
jgi:Domain of Unknown Function (DUF1206)